MAACGSDSPSGASRGPATCDAQADRELEACGGADAEDRKAYIEVCESDRARLAVLGCGESYDAWLACASGAKWDCDDGPAGCEGAQRGYLQCQSRFVQRTGCTSIGADDERCTDGEPHAFGCSTAKPPKATCVPMPDSAGSAASLYCCP